MTTKTSLPQRVQVLVTGAGFPGPGPAIQLGGAGHAVFPVSGAGYRVGLDGPASASPPPRPHHLPPAPA